MTFLRGRGRERETPVTSLISRWNREWSCIWLPLRRRLRRVDPTRRRVLSLSSARTSKVHVKTKSLALERSIEQQQGRVIDERRWGSGSFAFAGQTAVDHPAAFRWHASSKKNRPSWCLFSFRMATVLPLRTAWIADILSQASLRDVQRQRCWKRGSGDGQRLWDYFTARLSDLSMPLTSEVRRSPEPSARPSAAADSEERQICTTCLFAESVGLCLCFLPSCAMYKDNAVGNVVAETGRDLVFMITARLSDLSMPLKGEVRRSPVQSARQPIARSGKFVRRAYSRRALDCEKDDGLTCMYAFSCMLSPIVIVEHTSVCTLRGGWGKRGDLTWHPAVKHQRPAAKTTNSNCCDRAAAQVK